MCTHNTQGKKERGEKRIIYFKMALSHKAYAYFHPCGEHVSHLNPSHVASPGSAVMQDCWCAK